MLDIKKLYERLEACTDDEKRLDLLFDLTVHLLNFDEKRTFEAADELKTLAERIDSNLGRSYYHSARGRVLFKKSQFAEATKEFKQALEMAQLTDNLTHQATCLDTLGIIYTQEGKSDKAIEASTQALEIFKQLPNTARYQLVCINNLGNAYKRKEDFAKAEEVYLQGLELARQDKDERMEANILNNLSGINIMQLKFPEAAKYVRPALAIFKRINHKHGEVHATVFLGHCLLGMGEYAKAMDQYLLAQKLLKQVDHKPIEAQLYKGLAEVYVKMQALPEALDNYKKALRIAIAIDDTPEICDLYIDLAKLYLMMQEPAKAKDAIEQGLPIAQQQGFAGRVEQFWELQEGL